MSPQAKDYILTFEVTNQPALFQELAVRYYVQVDLFATIEGEIGRMFIAHSDAQRATEQGTGFFKTAAPIQEIVEKLQNQFNEIRKQKEKWLTKNTVWNEQEVENILDVCVTLHGLYGHFYSFHIEGAYLLPESPARTEVMKVLDIGKNSIRETYNELFLDPQGLYHAFLNQLESQFDLDKGDLQHYLVAEIRNLHKGTRVALDEMSERRQAFVLIKENGVFSTLQGALAAEFVKKFGWDTRGTDTTSVTGTSASKIKTKVTGRVKIVNSDYANFEKTRQAMRDMKKGDVLISITTAPELMEACHKAAAIVTDLGGLLSHAAIVSRELGIPCVVGTQHATKVFKDGDMVEVDAEKGIVRIV